MRKRRWDDPCQQRPGASSGSGRPSSEDSQQPPGGGGSKGANRNRRTLGGQTESCHTVGEIRRKKSRQPAPLRHKRGLEPANVCMVHSLRLDLRKEVSRDFLRDKPFPERPEVQEMCGKKRLARQSQEGCHSSADDSWWHGPAEWAERWMWHDQATQPPFEKEKGGGWDLPAQWSVLEVWESNW